MMRFVVAVLAVVSFAAAAQALPVLKAKDAPKNYTPINGNCTTRCTPTFGGGSTCNTFCW